MNRPAARILTRALLVATIGSALLPNSLPVATATAEERTVPAGTPDESGAPHDSGVQLLRDVGSMPADEPRLRDARSFGKWLQNRFAPTVTVELQADSPAHPERFDATARTESVRFPQRVIPLRL